MKVAVLYSTKDRPHHTRRSFPRIVAEKVDVYWFDGSVSEEGKCLPYEFTEKHENIKGVFLDIGGGPDVAIAKALLHAKDLLYDWIILIENDVVLLNGWLDAMLNSIKLAERDGFNVQGASVRVYKDRVLAHCAKYNLIFNSGAGFFAVKRECIHKLLASYRTTSVGELRRLFRDLASLDILNEYSFHRNDSTLLSADWFFDAVLYLSGGVVASTPVSMCVDIDEKHIDELDKLLVCNPNELDGFLSTEKLKFNKVDPIHYAFLRLINDSSLFIPIHFLYSGSIEGQGVGMSTNGRWGLCWNQCLGPFGIHADVGSFTITCDASQSALVLRVTGNAELEVAINNVISKKIRIDTGPNRMVIVPLSVVSTRRERVSVSVNTNNLTLIGFCVNQDSVELMPSADPESLDAFLRLYGNSINVMC